MNRASFVVIAAGTVAGLAGAAGVARAGVFEGFGGREDAYLVGADRVCTPLAVAGGAARGAPACHKAASDEIAGLSIKPAKAERGSKAQFAAEASGRTLTVRRPDGGAVVTWDSLDPISRVVDVYASTYGNVVAVELMLRRGGRDQADVVAFTVGQPPPVPGAGSGGAAGSGSAALGTGAPPHGEPGAGSGAGTGSGAGSSSGAAAGGADPTPTSAALTRALTAARKAKGKAAAAAWAKVLAVDPDNSEGRYGVAAAAAAAHKDGDALAALDALARSRRADAVELLVAARFDAAFAALRGDARFRKAVGLDRPAATLYEHVMGQGGAWEQTGTSCDTPGVELTLTRDRAFKLRVKSACEGDRSDDRFTGTWALVEPNLILRLPGPDGGNDEVPCTVEAAGGEDAIRCALDQDLVFVVKPTRR